MIIGHSALYPRAGDIAQRVIARAFYHGGNRFISEESVLRGLRRERKIKTRCVYYQRSSSTANRTKRTLRILVLCHDGLAPGLRNNSSSNIGRADCLIKETKSFIKSSLIALVEQVKRSIRPIT
jgi:hypothetical protein